MTFEWTMVPTPDGRELEVMTSGPPDAFPLVYITGSPTAIAEDPAMAAWSAERGWRLVGYSRPGYGESSRQPGRTVADAAGDVATILDALGHDRFVVLGWSGGGPHALACAALLPDRCAAAATLAGVAPYDAEGLDWTAGMGAENVEEFMLAVTHPEQLWDVIEPQAPDLANLTGAQVAEMLSGLTDEVDRAALTGEFAEVLAATFRRAVINGVGGWHDDDLAFAGPWGFDLTCHHRAGVGVAGRPRPDGAVRSRRVAGRQHPDCQGAPLPGRGSPVAGRADGADPRRPLGARRRRLTGAGEPQAVDRSVSGCDGASGAACGAGRGACGSLRPTSRSVRGRGRR